MSHHIPNLMSGDSKMTDSQSDPSPTTTICLNHENGAQTFGMSICEKREAECSKHCLENGAPYEMTSLTGSDAEKKQIISNSKCLDGFKIETKDSDSDKNAKSFHKCNGILHGDHNSGDKSYVINTCAEELSPLAEECNSNSHRDSLNFSATDRLCKQSDHVDLPVKDLHLNDPDKCMNMHSSSKDGHAEVDVLLTEIEKTSLCIATLTTDSKAESCVITYEVYESEKQMPDIMRLITKDLSEPYSIYTYRYFIHNWPKLCFLAMANNVCVGAIVCKLDLHKKMVRRGYIAMLAVDSEYRRRQIGLGKFEKTDQGLGKFMNCSSLVTKAIEAMIRDDCDEVVLETEITNQSALHLYENLGFVRDKRLFRYYLNGVDALRLKLWLR